MNPAPAGNAAGLAHARAAGARAAAGTRAIVDARRRELTVMRRFSIIAPARAWRDRRRNVTGRVPLRARRSKA
ncbi:MAG: hypothetical protein IVW54_12320 [Candidatus Binataceae bacterium]|nr:hypothetical protein [Candidatus Binataceae bacterium]